MTTSGTTTTELVGGSSVETVDSVVAAGISTVGAFRSIRAGTGVGVSGWGRVVYSVVDHAVLALITSLVTSTGVVSLVVEMTVSVLAMATALGRGYSACVVVASVGDGSDDDDDWIGIAAEDVVIWVGSGAVIGMAFGDSTIGAGTMT